MEKKLRNLYVLTGTYILYTSIYVPGNEFGKKKMIPITMPVTKIC